MKHILIVEDEISIAQLYKTKLQLHDYKIDVAHNGLEALQKIKQHPYDLVLLDLMMPIVNGEQFLERIRRHDDFKDLPVIVLTNVSRQEAPRTLWHHGISGYFVKAHHTPSDLLKIVDKELQTPTTE